MPKNKIKMGDKTIYIISDNCLVITGVMNDCITLTIPDLKTIDFLINGTANTFQENINEEIIAIFHGNTLLLSNSKKRECMALTKKEINKVLNLVKGKK